ncbi:MAG: hypothetical protein RLZZ501_1216 [Pseudomonadota bacterium]
MIAVQIKPHEDAMTDARETTTLIGLLDWAYRRQRIDADDSRALHELEMLAGGGGSSAASVAQNGLLGCTIHSTAHKQRPAHHPDAATVADCVALLAAPGRWLVEQHARAGTVPDWGQSRHWVPSGRYDHERGVAAETVAVRYPHGKTAVIVVRACPVEMSPGPEAVAMMRAEYRRWHRALDVLATLLGGASLQRWRVEGIGAPGVPWA